MDFLENEIPAYYQYYVDLASQSSIDKGFEGSTNQLLNLIDTLPKEKQSYAYAEGKWTIKEVILHIIDTERVFQYRALRFARNDKTMLPGFDQDLFADYSEANNRSLSSLREEFIAVRKSTEQLYTSFSKETLLISGNASDTSISIRAIGYVMIGHLQHHLKIINERYL